MRVPMSCEDVGSQESGLISIPDDIDPSQPGGILTFLSLDPAGEGQSLPRLVLLDIASRLAGSRGAG